MAARNPEIGLMQALVVVSLAITLWVACGYSVAFDDGNAVFGP